MAQEQLAAPNVRPDHRFSSIDMSLAGGFRDAPLEEITEAGFEAWWAKGRDTPFWFP